MEMSRAEVLKRNFDGISGINGISTVVAADSLGIATSAAEEQPNLFPERLLLIRWQSRKSR